MPALNFASRFAGPVGDGTKRQTVRKKRKRPINRGDTLHLYTGMRTKGCRKLREETCQDVKQIVVTESALALSGGMRMTVLDKQRADGFAQLDGLADFAELRDWLRDHYGLPFTGVVYYW